MNQVQDSWNSGDPYEYFMGRWSSKMAPRFLDWLNVPGQASWLEIGCGTGALSEAIQKNCNPSTLTCIDPSPAFLEKTRQRLAGNPEFAIGSASTIPKPDQTFDFVVSALALNFFPDLPRALSEMKRVVKINGTIAAYVWDYADRMDLLRHFWDAAITVDPGAAQLDEGKRFPICNQSNLKNLFTEAGLLDIQSSYLDIDTVFTNFDDYWEPFLGGQGPAPGYVISLNKDLKQELKTTLQNTLPVKADGTIKLMARAIAIRGTNK